MIGAKTDFSLKESVLSAKYLVNKAKELGYDAIAIADTSSINALTKIFAEAKKADIKAIIGVTFTVTDDIHYRDAKRGTPKTKKPRFHRPVLYARDQHGLSVIMNLVTLSNDANHFYYNTQINLEELLSAIKEGGVVYSTGEAYSTFTHPEYIEILHLVDSACITSTLQSATPNESLMFGAVVPVDTPYYDMITQRAISWIKFDATRNLIISKPVLHKKGKADVRNTMDCILNRNKVDSPWRNEPAEFHPEQPAIIVMMVGFQQARISANSTGDLSDILFDGIKVFEDSFTYEFKKMPISLPEISTTPKETLLKLSIEGWKNRIAKTVLGYKPDASELPKYKERLKYELKTLNDMGFENYFLLVEKLTTWCAEEGIFVGPGRGSVGGSLVAYLLGITDVDPIRFGLIFERFINPSRLDLPDIDLDFMSSRRHEVVTYLRDQFGEDNVAGISNYGVMGPSSSLRAVGSAHNLTQDEISCSKMVPKEHGIPMKLEACVAEVPELERFAIDHPSIWEEAVELQGVFKNYGTHAAGIVVSGVPIKERAVVERRKDKVWSINWDKRVVEDFGLVKLDVLGLQTLDILAKANEYLIDDGKESINYKSIELTDGKVLAGFAKAETKGVFQFEGGGMRHLLKELADGDKISFEDITAATALFRPGPIDAGLMDDYVQIKQGASYPNYLHPAMEPALKETQSVIVYQEQVMQIARDLAGFSFAEADVLRKAMGKKDHDLMAQQRSKWVDGCLTTHNMDIITSGGLFDQVEKFAGYGFNKSHSVEYTIISYWSMYVKTYHPAVFYAAALSVLDEPKLMGLVKEAETKDIFVRSPDINKSSDRYEVVKELDGGISLYAPFQAVKGISEKGAAAILEAQLNTGAGMGLFTSKANFLARVNKRFANIRVQSALDKIGAFASIESDQLPASDISRLRDQKELLPGIVTRNVMTDRSIMKDKESLASLREVLQEVQGCSACSLQGECHPKPKMGKTAKIMIVTDCPNWGEEKMMGTGEGCTALREALKVADIPMADVYLTSLVKALKGSGQTLQNESIIGCSGFLDREIEILKPPVIVVLGSAAFRHLYPEAKGGWEELNGQVQYISETDMTLVCGLNPLMVHFDKTKQIHLNDALITAKSLFKLPTNL